jgi:hypothetical protein
VPTTNGNIIAVAMTLENVSNSIADESLMVAILRALERRDEAKSVGPSEIARSLSDHKSWQPLIPRIRSVVAQLVREKRVIVTRGTKVLSVDDIEGGPIRIRRGPLFG